MIEAVLIVISAVVTATGVVLGQRFIARSSEKASQAEAKIEQQKVNQVTFDSFIARYERDRENYEKEKARLIHQLDQTNGMLAVAISHIKKLMKAVQNGEAVPPLPPELKNRMWFYSED